MGNGEWKGLAFMFYLTLSFVLMSIYVTLYLKSAVEKLPLKYRRYFKLYNKPELKGPGTKTRKVITTEKESLERSQSVKARGHMNTNPFSSHRW